MLVPETEGVRPVGATGFAVAEAVVKFQTDDQTSPPEPEALTFQ